jgi:hypothetical protein
MVEREVADGQIATPWDNLVDSLQPGRALLAYVRGAPMVKSGAESSDKWG